MYYNSLNVMQCSGYQPPEHIETGEISRKFDIFSLGIVIIKIVSGPEGYAIYLDGMSTDEFNKDEFINQVRNHTSC